MRTVACLYASRGAHIYPAQYYLYYRALDVALEDVFMCSEALRHYSDSTTLEPVGHAFSPISSVTSSCGKVEPLIDIFVFTFRRMRRMLETNRIYSNMTVSRRV